MVSILLSTFGVPIVAFGCLVLFAVYFLLTEHQENQTKTTAYNDSSPTGGVHYHIIFSTGCTTNQDWQSYVFFHGVVTSGQPGRVTRIVSGCTAENEQTLRAIFAKQIAPMAAPGRFQLHFTPDYKNVKPGADYKYWNKPFGLKHWLEHALGFPHPSVVDEDSIVILLDPDQLIIRPFTNNNFSNTDWKFLAEGQTPRTKVEHGKPMGQLYGFGLDWKKIIDMTKVTKEHSPVLDMSDKEAQAGYIVGPPYIATARDMYQIALKWSEFAVPVHDQHPELLAEMYAYCLAAAHLGLSHQTAASFMVSDIDSGKGEGWQQYVDQLSETEVCETRQDPDRYPNVIHFCQRYGLGPYFFGKYRFPKDFLSCESPLFKEPPPSLALDYTDKLFPDGKHAKYSRTKAKRSAFMICQLISAVNDAAEYFKRHNCDVSTTNFNKTIMIT